MARFKLPSKFHEQPNVCGRTFGASKHLFGQETPLGSFMPPWLNLDNPLTSKGSHSFKVTILFLWPTLSLKEVVWILASQEVEGFLRDTIVVEIYLSSNRLSEAYML
ncbi:hypothetical protein GOBAR_AA35345 [Gossypium barbadense]|uniref:Uncharacterized protein n=1 Tax=Gossypium barbadense TaxID=3634 RepID=A0A2P5W2M5_GOSBA|nr:hypothetical protein GOBAR_AA35345 [Gossypium barbadense]